MKIKHTLQTILTVVVSFDEFKKFLKERNCYKIYAVNFLEHSLRHKVDKSLNIDDPYTWIQEAFIWHETFEGLEFWCRLNDVWQGLIEEYKSKYKIDNVKGVLHYDEDGENVIEVKFQDFVKFLKEHFAFDTYFDHLRLFNIGIDEYLEFINKNEPQYWIDAFLFCNTINADFWYFLKDEWQKFVGYVPAEQITYIWNVKRGELKKYF